MVALCEGCDDRAEKLADSLIKVFLTQNTGMREEINVVLWDDWMNTEHVVTCFDS